jgi:hypothetical protein
MFKWKMSARKEFEEILNEGSWSILLVVWPFYGK